VRAEFVFMMGGELAEEVIEAADLAELNEEAHAEADDEVLAGRLANQGRAALIQAIRSMSRANALLTSASLTQALAEERRALESLQRAFARTRYILRAFTQRERLDLTRRLTGPLLEAGRDVRPNSLASAGPRTVALRRTLAGIATLAAAPGDARDAAGRATLLAERVLRADPSNESLQRAAALLTDAAVALADGLSAEARELLDRIAVEIALVVRDSLPDSPSRAPGLDIRRLEGALSDALRRGRGSR
jgi:hypothetical protein